MRCNLTVYQLPSCTHDYYTDSTSPNKFLWKNELRLNKVDIAFPDIQCSIESEQLWTVVDVLQDAMLKDKTNAKVSETELLRYSEFKKYGKQKIQEALKVNFYTIDNSKVIPKRSITILVDSISLEMKNPTGTIMNVDLLKLQLEINGYSNGTSTFIVGIHKIDLFHNSTPVLSPMLPKGERYLDSNEMFSLRLKDMMIPGIDGSTWPGVDHLEVNVYPIVLNLSMDLFKNVYKFIFPPVEENPTLIYEFTRNKSRQVKPLGKRPRLPRFYRYVNINPLKLSLTGFKLKNTKIQLDTFAMKLKLKTLQGLIDSVLGHVKAKLTKQVPAIVFQFFGGNKKILEAEAKSDKRGFFDRHVKRGNEEESPQGDLSDLPMYYTR